MRFPIRAALAAALAAGAPLVPAAAQVVAPAGDTAVTRIDLSVGRSRPLTTTLPISKISVAVPEIADVVLISEREFVINAKAPGETDAIIWPTGGTRLHYRVVVTSPSDRLQLVLYVKFAEVRRDLLQQLGASAIYRDQGTRAGTGIFRGDNVFGTDGTITLPSDARFLTVLTDFGTDRFLALLEAEEQRGTARVLAEPNLMAAHKDTATFLAGGELPIPIVSSVGDLGGTRGITIQYREFGVRLKFLGEILSDSLVRLYVRPEVSSLDYANAVELEGFRIPALRTRRVESTLDVRRNESLVISGLMNNEQERVKTGVPLLMHIPVLGALFSSSRFQRNETELIVVVTPVVIDPLRPRPIDVVPTVPDTTQPARDALRRQPPSRPPLSGGRPPR